MSILKDVFEDGKQVLDKEAREMIEELAAAFIKKTDLPPDQVVMVIERIFDSSSYKFIQRIWFEKRKE